MRTLFEAVKGAKVQALANASAGEHSTIAAAGRGKHQEHGGQTPCQSCTPQCTAPCRFQEKHMCCTTTTRTCYSHSVLKSYAEQGRNAYAATTTTAGTTGDAACLAVVLDAWLVQLLQPTTHRRDHQTLSTNSSASSSNSNSTHTRTTHCWIEMIGCMVDQGLWWCLMVYVHNRCIINSSPLAALRGSGWWCGFSFCFTFLLSLSLSRFRSLNHNNNNNTNCIAYVAADAMLVLFDDLDGQETEPGSGEWGRGRE